MEKWDKIEPKVKKDVYKLEDNEFLLITALRNLTLQIKRLADKQ